jgi:hypothetical protein
MPGVLVTAEPAALIRERHRNSPATKWPRSTRRSRRTYARSGKRGRRCALHEVWNGETSPRRLDESGRKRHGAMKNTIVSSINPSSSSSLRRACASVSAFVMVS